MAAMATTPIYLGALAKPSTFSKSCIRPFSTIAPLYAPRSGANLSKEKAAKEKAKKRKKKHTMYKQYDLREAEQFTLCDAMRYVLKQSL
jgi:large subunit ribosomal protein L1